MFQERIEKKHFENMKSLYGCHLKDVGSVSAHILKIKVYTDRLWRLSFPISQELAKNIMLILVAILYVKIISN